MKRSIIVILLVICATGQVAFAQIKTQEKRTTIDKITGDSTITESLIISETEDITPRRHMLIVNPLKFFLFYNLSYFHKINNLGVLGGGIQIPTVSGLSGYGGNLEFRFHPSKKSPRGFYIAPNIAYNRLNSSEDNETVTAFSVGTLIGWQWFPSDEFAIGLGIGVDYYVSSATNVNDDFESYNGFAPALRFDIGYAW